MVEFLGTLLERAEDFLARPRGRRIQMVRREGSPPYTWIPGSIAAAADEYIYVDSQFPRSRKYSPLDTGEFVNNDSVDLTITINAGEPWPLPAGTTRPLTNQAMRSINVHNDDAATATTQNKVVITLWRSSLDIDEHTRQRYG